MESFSELTIIIPTFYPGPIIKKCIKSLPVTADIIIVDNSYDEELRNTLNEENYNIRYYNVGDIGLPRSFNFALTKARNNDILITQPDVEFTNNAIKELIAASKKYENIGLLAPLVYENNKYSIYDSLDLKLSKNGKIKSEKKNKKNNKIPSGDFCVEAVNATAMLLKKNIILGVGGWDENIYTYLEDLDLCIRLRKESMSLIKVHSSIVHHIGFGSHKVENKNQLELSRNWHFCWSSLYFRQKYYSNSHFIFYYLKVFFKYLIKSLLNLTLLKFKKSKKNFFRFRACINYLTIKKSNFRIRLK